MSIDPLVLARQGFGRNGMDEDAGPPNVSSEAAFAIRPPTAPASRGIAGLGMRPGTPEYNARIPPPETPTVEQVGDLVMPNGQPMTSSPQQAAEHGSRRVAIYTPRQPDVFSIQIEEAPDWETVESFRIPEESTVHLLHVLRAIGVKIMDKTGGDLVEAQQDYEQRQDRQGRKPTAKGARAGHGGGRPKHADRPPQDQWSGITAEIGALDEPAGVGGDPDGPAGC